MPQTPPPVPTLIETSVPGTETNVDVLGSRRKIAWAEELAILMGVGGLVYFAVCAVLGIDVTKHIRLKRAAAS